MESARIRLAEKIRALQDEDPIEVPQNLPTWSTDDWEEGTEELAGRTVPELASMLGLSKPHIPGMAEKEHPTSAHDAWSKEGRCLVDSAEAVPLELFPHQWQGVVKLVHNMLAGRNTLLMDAVGVGKTAQAIATILMYEWIRAMQEADQLPAVLSE
ncbi:hypothetical protein K466DRAFT_508135 [Polyporus arcularius HHB13444]|uniref:SNF2 N-terminal domain-containing protein n=1 Tax=Polyporus arcularius HHB13444 TaxID=1314778 RepID=A0A5C3NM45_9APHY|nr:hypothetical protein K466DRAFT_508135 [Polyporus arcularius HHB13444]